MSNTLKRSDYFYDFTRYFDTTFCVESKKSHGHLVTARVLIGYFAVTSLKSLSRKNNRIELLHANVYCYFVFEAHTLTCCVGCDI